MPTVELQLAPLPHHVRTARLVGVAAARRAGLPDELVDELRWAVGEACSRAVAVHAAQQVDAPVRLTVHDDPSGLTVQVIDSAPEQLPVTDADPEALFDDADGEGVDPRVSLAVLDGLVDDVTVTPGASGTTVQLRWPLPARPV